MRARKSASRRRILAAATAASATALAVPVLHAAEWRFTPTLSASETYSDNVRLATSGNERSDFVTLLAPGFVLSSDGPRLKLRANYALQSKVYANSSGSEFSNQLDANANGQLIRELLYFDARANVSKQNISAFGAQSVNDINLNSNRTEVRSYSLSPYLRHNFGSTANAVLRYTHESVNTSTALLGVSNTDRAEFNLTSGSSFRKVTWGVNASTARNRYDKADDVSLSTASVNAAYHLSPTFSLTAVGGYEKDTYQTSSEPPEGSFYNAGFNWTPTSRTRIAASAGHRFFGNTYSLVANTRARNVVYSLNYDEDISSTQQQFLEASLISTSSFLNQVYTASIPDPVARQQFVDAFITANNLPAALATPVNGVANRYFLQKRFQGSVALTGARNTIVLSVFETRRTPQSAALTNAFSASPFGGIDDNNKQLGANAVWNLQLSARASANASLNYTRTTSLTTADVSNLKTARVALTKRFQPKLSGSVELRRSQQSSSTSNGDIRENAITASVLMQF